MYNRDLRFVGNSEEAIGHLDDLIFSPTTDALHFGFGEGRHQSPV
jgi:hypothetical protein